MRRNDRRTILPSRLHRRPVRIAVHLDCTVRNGCGFSAVTPAELRAEMIGALIGCFIFIIVWEWLA